MTEDQPANYVQSWQVNVVIFLLLLLIGIAGAQVWKAYQVPSPTETKWEYMLGTEPDTTLTNVINKLGAEGWELVFARRASVGEIDVTVNTKPEFRYEMIFRRPLRSTHPRF